MRWINHYIKQIAEVTAAGEATEFSYRTPIEKMLQAASAEFKVAADILQEPTRSKDIGAPDFRISAKGGGIIGYVECKTPGDNLAKRATKKQIEKYRALSENMLLTDSWRWVHFYNGEIVSEVTLAKNARAEIKKEFQQLLLNFIKTEVEKIGDAKRLAVVLARRCALLREGLRAHKDDEEKTQLHGLVGAFKTALDIQLTFEKFSDTFAQTVVYSLLLAKLRAPAGTKLTLVNANQNIPANFGVIREIALFLQTLNHSEYKNITWVLDDILAIVNVMNTDEVTNSMAYRKRKLVFDEATNLDDDEDPYIYFYEDFLAAYDATQRERRGVYYTPTPVVKFIVRAVDDLLRRDFNLPNGLAQTDAVTALDFAAGTGTFMLEMFRTVLKDKQPAKRNLLTHDHILKNFYGFELLMAPYVISHLKLSQYLAEEEVPLKEGERIKIFLTNTLELPSKQVQLPMLPNLAAEANLAQDIKRGPVLVITGNPPYSVRSQNTGKWISGLINDYKYINDEKIKERNSQSLQDDYVKFIRFAQWKMEQVEHGIVAVITNHGFFDNPTFRGMRHSLLDTFDAIHLLDLHGNTNKKETAPDGGKDENVFDIRQGVAISILVKNPKIKRKGVFHADLYGKRNDKYNACLDSDITTVRWRKVTPTKPFYFFIPRDEKAAKKYEKYYSVKDMFVTQGMGIKTNRDHFSFAFGVDDIKTRISKMIDSDISTEYLREMYNLKETRDWSLDAARKTLMENSSFDDFLKPCQYRPFDVRWCYYGKETMEWPCPAIMHHMLAGKNLGLVTVRQVKAGKTWQHCLVSKNIVECTYVSNKTGEVTYLVPLYRYDREIGETIRRENLKPEFRRWLDDRYGNAHSPEAILGCIYAILHSPDYRNRYADFLRTDFPRILFPPDNAEFTRLATIGNDLINAHLLDENCNGTLAELCGKDETHFVEQVKYVESSERLYFNKTDEYFAPIPPQVFNFQIGCYLPLDQYLKSRKARTLNLQDIETIQKAANAIAFTIEKMKEIDQ